MTPHPFFWGGRGGRRGAPEGLPGSGPSSALGGTGRGAGARCALRAALGGCLGSAPDAFGMRFPTWRTGSSLAQPPSNAPARARNAHYLAGPSDPAERTDALCRDSLPRSLGRSQRARAGHPARRCRGSRPWVGEGGPASPFSPFLPQLAVGLLCFPFAAGRVRLLALSPRRPACPDSAFRPGPFRFPSSLTRLLFSLPFASPGKVASPSLLKSLPSLRGGGWDGGV